MNLTWDAIIALLIPTLGAFAIAVRAIQKQVDHEKTCDLRYQAMNTSIQETKTDVRDIKNYLISGKP